MRAYLQPLNLAALFTWAAVALSLQVGGGQQLAWAWTLMAVFLGAMVVEQLPRVRAGRAPWWPLAVECIAALGVCGLAAKGGAAPVLLVVVAAQLSMLYGLRVAAAIVGLLDVALVLVLVYADHPAPLAATAIYAGFQAFAMVVGHASRSAEQARDALARVNADLLATRALMTDAARDAERLRVARELHDVAGHTLTALNLNLRVLAADPALAARGELALSQRLASDLLAQIRDVVHALRDARGLDLATALHALAAPMPTLRIALDLDPAVQVHDLETADIVLRTVQEALTNAARHADARTLSVAVSQQEGAIALAIEDDGVLRGPLREGSGLTGMRERIEGVGGTLLLAHGVRGGLAIRARIPA